MRTSPAYRAALTAITLLVVAVAGCWAVLTPAFRTPDEPQHVNSVLRLAYGGGWPAPGDAQMSPAMDVARQQAALESDLPGRYWNREHIGQYTDVDPLPDDERAVVSAGNALPDPDIGGADRHTGPAAGRDDVDQMTQHPPLYYAVAAGWLHATGTAQAPWDHLVLSLRIFDVLLLAPLPLLAAATVRTLLRNRPEAQPAALVAAAAVLFLPMSAHILTAVTNDALIMLSGGVTTWLVARVLMGDLRWRTAIGLGVALGVGLLTKVMMAFALPMVVVAYLLAGSGARPVLGDLRRAIGARRSEGMRALVAVVVAFAVGGWWWARNLVVLGTVQPVGIPERWEPVPNAGIGHFATTVLTGFTRSFFGDFGWLELRVQPVTYWSGAVIVAVLCTAALVRADARRGVAVLLALPVALWAGVVVNAWNHYMATGWVTAIQGRYLFAGLVALASVAALGIRPPSRAVPWIVAGAGVVAAAGLVFVFRGMYVGYGEGIADGAARLAAWSPLSPGQVVAVVVSAVVAGAVAIGACLRLATVDRTRRAVTTTAATASAASTTDGTGASR